MKTTLDTFSSAILGEADLAPLVTPLSLRGLEIYRSNHVGTLLSVLADHYPVTQSLLGADNFRFFAHRFTRAHPPSHDSLSNYGADFPAFLAEQPEIATTQPELVYFALVDFAQHHPQATSGITLELPEHIPAHYDTFARTGALGQEGLGELRTFRFEQ